MTDIMVRAEDIDVAYGDVRVLQAVSLAVTGGSFIGILGPNGCGKTTFLRALSRVLKPTAGTVHVEEKDISDYSIRDLATRIGAVPQETTITFDFTVEEIVQMGRHPYLGPLSSMKKEDYEICRRAMAQTNTTHLADRLITEISGGERQRVLIARALAQQPKVLLLDEPTSHLDINHQIEILSIIRGLTPTVTVISVFHDLNLAACFCDRILLMEKGQVVAAGAPADVLTGDLINRVFGVRMMVRTHPLTGRPYLVPRYEPARSGNDCGLHIHVVCGGGTGAETMYALLSRGYHLTAGVLSANDSDCTTAEALGIDVVKEPPFSPVSATSLASLRDVLRASDAVIVTGMPVGPGNIANLRALEGVSPASVYILAKSGSSLSSRDYTGGEATAVISALCASGAVRVKSVPDLLGRLGRREEAGAP